MFGDLMANNLLEAVVEFLQTVMADELDATSITPKVFSDYIIESTAPYVVIADISETYSFQSGSPPTFLADGVMPITFFATTKAQAMALGRSCVLHFLQEEDAGDPFLVFSGGYIEEFRPGNGSSATISDISVGQPTIFAWTVQFHYKEQFSTIS